MDTTELFQRFSLALAIGLLIGIERGWQTRDEAEKKVARREAQAGRVSLTRAPVDADRAAVGGGNAAVSADRRIGRSSYR